MAYGVKVGIKVKDIYDRLTPAEKERFEEIVISGVDKTEKESWDMQNIGKMSNCPKRSL